MGMNILLVDDEPKNVFALRELLADLKQNLLSAASGEEALRIAAKHDLAAVLLDVRMPGMDGFQVARELRARERSRTTPIVFLTAAADELESVFRGYEVGAIDYLVKPIVPQVLKAKVAVYVELQRKNLALAESEQKLRALASHLISVREEERAHIAREVHDELGQVLTGLKMDVGWLGKQLRPEQQALADKADAMGRLIDGAVQTVRKIAAGLRPEVLDEMGLVAAIGWQAEEFQKRTGIRCRLSLPPEEVGELSPDLQTTMFRVFQEILTNVARHSRATRVDVDLKSSPLRLVLEVADNGIGISGLDARERKSLGLLGMQERALRVGGEVSIGGVPGRGTRVVVQIPVAQGPA
jgi:signal transduction histidine kinase